MKQILVAILSLIFFTNFALMPPGKRPGITGSWILVRHVLTINGAEQTCFDSTNKKRLSNRDDFRWLLIINKKNTYEISDATKKNVIKGKWKLSADKKSVFLFNSFTYPTSDDGTPLFPQQFIIDRTLLITSLTEKEFVVNEKFCSRDTIGISYYRRVR